MALSDEVQTSVVHWVACASVFIVVLILLHAFIGKNIVRFVILFSSPLLTHHADDSGHVAGAEVGD